MVTSAAAGSLSSLAPAGGLHVARDLSSTAPDAGLTVVGELDAGTAPWLEVHLDRVFADGCRQVAVDMRQLGFCDVSGLNLLLTYDARLKAANGSLVVRGPCAALQVLLEILGPEISLQMADLPDA